MRMNPIQFIQLINNPQKFAADLMNNSQVMSDPRVKKATQLIQNQDSNGLRLMAENLCKEYGITTDQAVSMVKQNFMN